MRTLGVISVFFLGCGAAGSADSLSSDLCGLSATGRPTDLAVDGPGFLLVRTSEGLRFTRDGRLRVEADGTFVHQASGGAVQQHLGLGLTDLRLPTWLAPARASRTLRLRGNLNADATPLVFDITNPAGTSVSPPASGTLYDALGGAYAVDAYFTKTGPGHWEMHAVVDGAFVVGGSAGDPSEIASASLAFDELGRLMDASLIVSNFAPVATGTLQPLEFDFGSTFANDDLREDAVTQFSSAHAPRLFTNDGLPPGTLRDFTFKAAGQLDGRYDNGLELRLAELALARFPDARGFNTDARGLFAETPETGRATIGRGSELELGIIHGGFELPRTSACR